MDGATADIGAISADSHVTEPPNCFIDNIEARFRDIAPRMVRSPSGRGDVFVIDGMQRDVPMGLAAAAGRDPVELRDSDKLFEDLHPGGWDPKARIADQDRDGVIAEIIYPTVAMMVCNHPDGDYRRACFQAYNRWIEEFQAGAPDRLFAMPLTAARTVDEAIADLQDFRRRGFRGVVLSGMPSTEEDYDDPSYERLWSAAEELDMPVSFHVFADSRNAGGLRYDTTHRGPQMNMWAEVIRANQTLIGMFVLSGIFERHPKLRIVGVEGDAGWAPHYKYRLDHAFAKHRYWLKTSIDLKRKPSEYFDENVYLTFQDDWVAFKTLDLMNPNRLMWANDFPHSDSTWPMSRQLLAEHTAHVAPDVKRRILRDNVKALYGLPI